MTHILLIAGLSYLLGSIPFGYLLVRAFRGEDIRRSGSGNIGATNVARSSASLGVATLLLDAMKGAAAVWISELLNPGGAAALLQWDQAAQHANTATHAYIIASVAALFVIFGHMFPVWLRFRGGKGVATGLGAFVVLAPKSILVVIGVFLIIVAVFRYVSLGSMLAVAVFPPIAWGLNDYHQTPIILWIMSVASVFIIAKHHANLRRLFSGTESRFQLRRV